MVALSDAITFTVPRSAVGGLMSISQDLLDRMHELLERNTEGGLSVVEGRELETLVCMAQFGQIVTMALQTQVKP
jgi:hypothetical protein